MELLKRDLMHLRLGFSTWAEMSPTGVGTTTQVAINLELKQQIQPVRLVGPSVKSFGAGVGKTCRMI